MDRIDILGISITNTTLIKAKELIMEILEKKNSRYSVFFVNAHTINLSNSDKSYKQDLNSADFVFGDGTGVRLAAKLIHGVTLKGNVNGTDLIPYILQTTSQRKYKCFLLGATEATIDKAATFFKMNFKGWELAGYHHGYILNNSPLNQSVIKKINDSHSDILLVGMGNPLQEKWIAKHFNQLNTKLSIGIGGLFSYWSGELDRAPQWMRKQGIEWLYILKRQPHKWKRYILGNVRFLTKLAFEKIKTQKAIQPLH